MIVDKQPTVHKTPHVGLGQSYPLSLHNKKEARVEVNISLAVALHP